MKPSAYLTWFQADAACEASGKRLPTGWEWARAARGTQGHGVNDGTGGVCITQNSTGPRNTGGGTACASRWGAQDMIGNVWEWTADWYAGLAGSPPTSSPGWPDTTGGGSYSGDVTWNIASGAFTGGFAWAVGLPAAALRGGA